MTPSADAMNRRAALTKLSAGALLSLGLWPGCTTPRRTASASFRFIVVNDTHYMSPECGAWLEGVVQRMNAHGDADFCLLAGDLTEHGLKPHLGAVRDIFNGLKGQTFPVIGNHDYHADSSGWAYDFVYPRRRNYLFRHRGWQFIGLDTSEGTRYEKTRIQPATMAWVDAHLPFLDQEKPTVIFTHFPLGAGVTYRPLNADALLDRFLPYNLQAVFSGHFHGLTERRLNKTLLTTHPCCALKRTNHDQTKAKGYYLCTASDGQITREFVEMAANVILH